MKKLQSISFRIMLPTLPEVLLLPSIAIILTYRNKKIRHTSYGFNYFKHDYHTGYHADNMMKIAAESLMFI